MTTLSDLAARGSLLVNDGYRTKATELGIHGYPVLRVAEVGDGIITPVCSDYVREEYRDKIGYKLSRVGDVLLTTKGTVGRRAIMPDLQLQFAYSPQLCFFRVLDDSIDHRWLYYWLGGTDFWSQAIGVSQQTDMAPYISLRDLRAIEIDLPPIEEQRGIAATLGALDDKIESNRRVISTASGLLDAIADDVSPELESVPLSELATVTRSTIDPVRFGDEQVDHFSLPAFDDGVWPERVPAASIKSNKLVLDGPSILISRLNPRFNRTWWVVPESKVTALASTEFSCLSAATRSDLAALWLAVRDRYFREELTNRVTGTSGSHQRIRPDDLLSIEVPDTRQLSDYVKKQALDLLDLINSRRREKRRLAATRDTLLPELLSGRIRVPEAREVVQEAVG